MVIKVILSILIFALCGVNIYKLIKQIINIKKEKDKANTDDNNIKE